MSWASTLAAAEGATFEDRISYLNLLDQLKRPEFAGYLTTLQEDSVKNPNDVYLLINWLNQRHRALLAIEWSKRLPADLMVTMPVPVALAQSYVQLGDWTGLKPVVEPATEPTAKEGEAASMESLAAKDESVKPANWATAEYMRLALLSQTLRKQGNLQEAKVQWNAAVKAAGTRPDALSTLARVAIGWGWESESQEVLWSAARASADARWALDILYRRYAATGATRNMLEVVSRIHEINPSDAWATNNLASFSLLLDTNPEQGIKLAEELYRAEPQNSAYASTYAYALHLQGRTPEALQLMETLGEEKLRQPEYAAYYGVVLASAGRRDKAREFLVLGSKAPLLPEERKLLEQALAKVGPPN